MAEVAINEYRLPISDNSTKLGHRKGTLVRTHVPISFKNWKLVPKKYKDDLWDELKKSYDLPSFSKTSIMKQMTYPWRRFKCELRTKFYDKYPTDDERKKHTPPNIKYEDWEMFCANEGAEGAARRRVVNKRIRKAYTYTHTTGRKSHARVEAELKKANPGEKVTRTQVWVKAHTQTDGKVLPSAIPYLEKINKVKETINESEDTNDLSLDTDPLSQVFGKDSRGRARAIGAVSRTQIKASAPARSILNSTHSKDGEWRAKMDNTMQIMVGSIDALCEAVNEIKSTLPTRVFPSNTMDKSSSESEVARDMPCSLVNIEGDVIATGMTCTGDSSQIAHGRPILPSNIKVVIDNILLPNEKTIRANHCFAETFGEVGIGGFVVHPKLCVRYG